MLQLTSESLLAGHLRSMHLWQRMAGALQKRSLLQLFCYVQVKLARVLLARRGIGTSLQLVLLALAGRLTRGLINEKMLLKL